MTKKFFLAISTLILLSFSTPIGLLSGYERPHDVSKHEWEEVKPYLIPERHPVKIKLDKLFKKSRVTQNRLTIEQAGFENGKIAFFNKAIISKNSFIKGYFFKFYSDEQEVEIESKQWVDRAFESRQLQELIEKLGYEKYFVVPKKWIYLIPEKPLSEGPYPKHYVLVAKSISILKKGENLSRWVGLNNPKLLDALFNLIEKEGLPDSTVPHNIPFTRDHRVAFIDLEQHHRWPVPSERLLKHLNQPMGEHWQKLINNHRNSR